MAIFGAFEYMRPIEHKCDVILFTYVNVHKVSYYHSPICLHFDMSFSKI